MSDVQVRALRTFGQNLAFDALLAELLVVEPVVAGSDLGAVNWGVLGLSVVKTVIVTVFAGVHKWLDERKAADSEV